MPRAPHLGQGKRVFLTALILLAVASLAARAQVESPHRKGPHGLEGWTLSYDVPDYGALPRKLVLARNGNIIRQLSGEGFVWRWMFQADGRQVAFESGLMHFGQACVLVDILSGTEIGRYDCNEDAPPHAPAWVTQLKAKGELSFAPRNAKSMPHPQDPH